MATPKCGLGFNCAAMMQQAGISPADCSNYQTCGGAIDLSPEDTIELSQIRWEQSQRIEERIRITRHQAAVLMLQRRGAPQTLDDFEVLPLIESLQNQLAQLSDLLSSSYRGEDGYIAPPGADCHSYNVKKWVRDRSQSVSERESSGSAEQDDRIARVYWYNKLAAKAAIFAPSVEPRPVRVIHLSHDRDARNLEARRGIERRNRLMHLRTALTNLEQETVAIVESLRSPLNSSSRLEDEDR
jgi:hypothetical protein